MAAISRAFFWFHHIRSPMKRKLINSRAKDLDITGVCKHGYPGMLLVEGEESSVKKYIKEIKSLRWQAVEVRKVETEHGSDSEVTHAGHAGPRVSQHWRQLRKMSGGPGVEEVRHGSELSARMRAYGLHEFLREAMLRR
jgi:acylphosphatase